MAKLPAYVIRTAFFAMLAGVGGLWLLQMVFAYLGELENINDSYTLSHALSYIFYRSPYFLGQFIPTGVLLGAVVGLSLLSGSSEIVVMRAAGVSLLRIIGWVMMPALLFVALALAVNQWLLPTATVHAHAIKNPKDTLVSIDGYWAVMPNDTGGRQIVRIGHADSEGNLRDIKRFDDKDGMLEAALVANSGNYTGDDDSYTWQLSDVNWLTLDGQVRTHQSADLSLTLPISKNSVHLLTRDAEDLSISELYAHGQLMKHQQTTSKRHQLAFWQKLLSPLSVLSLLLVACSFVFGSLRSQSMGFRVVLALLTGLLFSYLQDLSGFVALATGLSPFMMVLLPIILSGAIGLYLLNKKS